MRLIDADALMEIYADRLSVVADRYSPDSSECGTLSGAMKLLSVQPTIEPDPDTVSRQAVRDAVCEELDSIDHVPQWVFDRLTKKIENLPPSPTVTADTDTISRKAATEKMQEVDWYHQNKNGEMVHGANSAEHQAWYKAEDVYKVLEELPSAQPEGLVT